MFLISGCCTVAYPGFVGARVPVQPPGSGHRGGRRAEVPGVVRVSENDARRSRGIPERFFAKHPHRPCGKNRRRRAQAGERYRGGRGVAVRRRGAAAEEDTSRGTEDPGQRVASQLRVPDELERAKNGTIDDRRTRPGVDDVHDIRDDAGGGGASRKERGGAAAGTRREERAEKKRHPLERPERVRRVQTDTRGEKLEDRQRDESLPERVRTAGRRAETGRIRQAAAATAQRRGRGAGAGRRDRGRETAVEVGAGRDRHRRRERVRGRSGPVDREHIEERPRVQPDRRRSEDRGREPDRKDRGEHTAVDRRQQHRLVAARGHPEEAREHHGRHQRHRPAGRTGRSRGRVQRVRGVLRRQLQGIGLGPAGGRAGRRPGGRVPGAGAEPARSAVRRRAAAVAGEAQERREAPTAAERDDGGRHDRRRRVRRTGRGRGFHVVRGGDDGTVLGGHVVQGRFRSARARR